MTSKYISVNLLFRLDPQRELALGIQQIGAHIQMEGVPGHHDFQPLPRILDAHPVPGLGRVSLSGGLEKGGYGDELLGGLAQPIWWAAAAGGTPRRMRRRCEGERHHHSKHSAIHMNAPFGLPTDSTDSKEPPALATTGCRNCQTPDGARCRRATACPRRCRRRNPQVAAFGKPCRKERSARPPGRMRNPPVRRHRPWLLKATGASHHRTGTKGAPGPGPIRRSHRRHTSLTAIWRRFPQARARGRRQTRLREVERCCPNLRRTLFRLLQCRWGRWVEKRRRWALSRSSSGR